MQQFLADAIEFVVGIREPSQISLAENGRAETGFSKNHHPSGALDQMGAGAGSHHQKKGIGHAAMQPHNGGETTEHLPWS